MIDPSSQFSQLAAMIRAQFGAGPRTSPKDRATSSRRRSNRDDTTAAKSHEPEPTIEQTIALRVAALSPDDPQRQRKAFRIFLESVLLQAFGRARLDDRGFDEMVDTVLQRMESDAELNTALHRAGALLLADGMPSSSP